MGKVILVGEKEGLQKIEVTLWDRWDIKGIGKNIKLIDVIKYLEKTYQGLEVRDILRGNAALYFHAILGVPGKEKEKEKLLHTKVIDIIEG